MNTAAPLLTIRLSNGTATAAHVEGMAYGVIRISPGHRRLYAVYDLHNGNGPTLGTINQVTGIFTPVGGGLHLGSHGASHHRDHAFTPGGTTADPTHETLYVIGDPNVLDSSTADSLYQANVVSGAVGNAPTFDAQGNVIVGGGIGQIIQGSANRVLQVVSAAFDASGRPLVLDRKSGRLLDLNLTLNGGGRCEFFSTDAGSINPTVTGIALDAHAASIIGR